MTSITGAIYGLHLADGIVRYVGQTRHAPQARFAAHLRAARRGGNFPVYRWITKHGSENISFSILAECDSLECMNECEIALIGSLPNLLNATPGGTFTPFRVQDPEWVAKRIKRGPEHHAYGTKRTQEWKDAQSAKTRGRAAYPASVASIQGAKHFNAKLTEDDVRAIRASTDTPTVQALRYGVSRSTIFGIRNGRRWKSVA